MSLLEKLTLTPTSPRQPQTPLARKRVRLLQKLELQISLAEAEAKDEQFIEEVQRWIRDEETGEKTMVTKHYPVRKWWWQNEHGAWMISLRDGNKIVPLTDDNTSVEVGGMEDMVSSLQTLRSAVIAGELDASLEKLVTARKASRTKNRKLPDMGAIFMFIVGMVVVYIITINWRLLILALTHPSMLVQFFSLLIVLLSIRGCAELIS